MKNKDLREKDDQALKQLLVETQRKNFDLRQQSVTEKVEDTSQFKKGKRMIARIKTLLHERASASAS